MAIQESKKFVRLRNPYTFGVPVRGPNNFFGREEELRLIFDTLENVPPGHKQDLVILGPRRIGKSSLLYRLLDLLHEHPGFVPVYVDVQNVKPRAIRPLFLKILRDIQKGYQHKKLLDQLPTFDTLTQSVIPPDLEFLTFTDDITNLNQAIASQNLPRLVLMFDEVELLLEIGGRDMLDWLRSLIQSLPYCAFVVAGSDRLYSLTEDYGSPFYNIFKTVELFPLSTQAARQMLTQTMSQIGVDISPVEVDRILEVTGNTPYFIQGIAHYLVEELNRQERNWVIPVDVDTVIKECVQYFSGQFNYLWNIAPRAEQIILYALAKGGHPRTIEAAIKDLPTVQALLTTFQQQHEAFRHLVREQLLKKVDKTTYRFAVPLFVNWITARVDDEEIIRLATRTTPELPRPKSLRDLLGLMTYLNRTELRDVFFILGIDYDSMGVQNGAATLRELILYMERRGRLPDLLQALREKRPDLDWPELI